MRNLIKFKKTAYTSSLVKTLLLYITTLVSFQKPSFIFCHCSSLRRKYENHKSCLQCRSRSLHHDSSQELTSSFYLALLPIEDYMLYVSFCRCYRIQDMPTPQCSKWNVIKHYYKMLNMYKVIILSSWHRLHHGGYN